MKTLFDLTALNVDTYNTVSYIFLTYKLCVLAVMKGIWVSAVSVCNRVMRTLLPTWWRPVGLTTACWFAVNTAPVSVASVCVRAITVGNSANVMTIVVNTIIAISAMVSPVDWHKNFAFLSFFKISDSKLTIYTSVHLL